MYVASSYFTCSTVFHCPEFWFVLLHIVLRVPLEWLLLRVCSLVVEFPIIHTCIAVFLLILMSLLVSLLTPFWQGSISVFMFTVHIRGGNIHFTLSDT